MSSGFALTRPPTCRISTEGTLPVRGAVIFLRSSRKFVNQHGISMKLVHSSTSTRPIREDSYSAVKREGGTAGCGNMSADARSIWRRLYGNSWHPQIRPARPSSLSKDSCFPVAQLPPGGACRRALSDRIAHSRPVGGAVFAATSPADLPSRAQAEIVARNLCMVFGLDVADRPPRYARP